MTQPTPDAIAAAKVAQNTWHIPSSIQLAQWALESGWGQHLSAPFNYWGMKALPGQPSVTVPTREVIKGRSGLYLAAFRSFASAAESFDAHAKLLATGAPYASARAKLPDVFAFANELGGGTSARPRYATDPKYGALIGSIIRGSNLTRYDK
jgi:flagellum-specific peptidoglycan hydrolase FlgJ